MPQKSKVRYPPAAMDDMDDSIVIHRILHGRRDYLRELFGSFD